MANTFKCVVARIRAIATQASCDPTIALSLDNATPDEAIAAAEKTTGLQAVLLKYAVDDVCLDMAQIITTEYPLRPVDAEPTELLQPRNDTRLYRVRIKADWVLNRQAALSHAVQNARPLPQDVPRPAHRVPVDAAIDGHVFRRLWLNLYLDIPQLLSRETNLAQRTASELGHHVFIRYYTDPSYDDSLKREYDYTAEESPCNHLLNIWRKRVYRLAQYAGSMAYSKVSIVTEHEWACSQKPLPRAKPLLIVCREHLNVYLVQPDGTVYVSGSSIGALFALAIQ
jgi:hypothetical protein